MGVSEIGDEGVGDWRVGSGRERGWKEQVSSIQTRTLILLISQFLLLPPSSSSFLLVFLVVLLVFLLLLLFLLLFLLVFLLLFLLPTPEIQVTVELRKNKREETLQKRRNVSTGDISSTETEEETDKALLANYNSLEMIVQNACSDQPALQLGAVQAARFPAWVWLYSV